MNNKITARIVAAVMAVAMLGTVSFATAIPTDAYNGTAADATTKTVLAFVSDSATATVADATNDNIVAVAQENTPVAINVSDAKIAGKDYLIVCSGNSNGDEIKTTSFLLANPGVTMTNWEVKKELVIGETKYTNVLAATYEFTAPTGRKVTKYGVKFGMFTEDNKDTVEENTHLEDLGTSTTKVEGDGKVTFTAAVFSVPEGTSSVGARAYFEDVNAGETLN